MAQFRQYLDLLTKARYFAFLILCLSSIALLIIFVLRLYSVTPLVVAAIFGCLFFLLSNSYRNRMVNRDLEDNQSRTYSHRLFKIFVMAFLILNSIALLVLNQLFEKPILYYAIIALGALFLTFQIIVSRTHAKHAFILFEIVLLATNLYASNQIVFPLGIGGADSGTHFNLLVAPIIELGHIPEALPPGFVYGSFSVHHIFVASSSIVLSSEPLLTYFTLGHVVMLLPIVMVFLICRSFSGPTAGLFSSLLLSGASYFVYWATHSSAITFAIPFVAVLAYLAMKYVNQISLSIIVMSVIFMTALILTHPYSSTIFAFILIGTSILGLLLHRKNKTNWRFIGFSLIFLLLLMAQWMHYSLLIETATVLGQEWFDSLTSESLIAQPGLYDSYPVGLIIINTIGDSLLVTLGVQGFLLAMSSKYSFLGKIFLNFSISLVILIFVGITTSLVFLLPNRIYVFLLLLGLTSLAGIALARWLVRNPGAGRSGWITIWNKARPPSVGLILILTVWNKARIPMVALIVTLTIFMSTASTIAGFETSPFNEKQPYVKLFDTHYEIYSVGWICNNTVPSQTIIVPLSLSPSSRHELYTVTSTRNQIVEKMPVTLDGRIDTSLLQIGSLMIYSEYDVEIGFQIGVTGRGKAGQGIVEKLDPSGYSELLQFSLLCDEGAIKIFLISE